MPVRTRKNNLKQHLNHAALVFARYWEFQLRESYYSSIIGSIYFSPVRYSGLDIRVS
jgi:hypothetical protein